MQNIYICVTFKRDDSFISLLNEQISATESCQISVPRQVGALQREQDPNAEGARVGEDKWFIHSNQRQRMNWQNKGGNRLFKCLQGWRGWTEIGERVCGIGQVTAEKITGVRNWVWQSGEGERAGGGVPLSPAVQRQLIFVGVAGKTS